MHVKADLMQGAIFHQANVNLTVFPRVHGQTLSCTAMPQAGYFCHEVVSTYSPMHQALVRRAMSYPWAGLQTFHSERKISDFILEEESDATI